jgi:hypothetical protein
MFWTFLEPPNDEPLLAYKTGIYLIVHNQSTLPFTMKTGINIQTGSETYVGVKRVFRNKLDDKRFSDCLTELKSENVYAKKLFGYFKDLNVTYYDQDFCYTLCYQDKLINTCNCCDILTPSFRGATYCANDVEMDCMGKFDTMFTRADLKKVCESACPQQCNSIEYETHVSTATFPTLRYLEKLQPISFLSRDENGNENERFFFPQNVSNSELMDFARTSFLKLIVNYDDFYYTSIDESEKKDIAGLFGELGGNLGLFIGLSILSFFELIELLVSLMFVFIEHKRRDDDDSEVKKKTRSMYSIPD